MKAFVGLGILFVPAIAGCLGLDSSLDPHGQLYASEDATYAVTTPYGNGTFHITTNVVAGRIEVNAEGLQQWETTRFDITSGRAISRTNATESTWFTGIHAEWPGPDALRYEDTLRDWTTLTANGAYLGGATGHAEWRPPAALTWDVHVAADTWNLDGTRACAFSCLVGTEQGTALIEALQWTAEGRTASLLPTAVTVNTLDANNEVQQTWHASQLAWSGQGRVGVDLAPSEPPSSPPDLRCGWLPCEEDVEDRFSFRHALESLHASATWTNAGQDSLVFTFLVLGQSTGETSVLGNPILRQQQVEAAFHFLEPTTGQQHTFAAFGFRELNEASIPLIYGPWSHSQQPGIVPAASLHELTPIDMNLGLDDALAKAQQCTPGPIRYLTASARVPPFANDPSARGGVGIMVDQVFIGFSHVDGQVISTIGGTPCRSLDDRPDP